MNSEKPIFISNNYIQTININNIPTKEINNDNFYKLKSIKQQSIKNRKNNIKNIHKMRNIQKVINNNDIKSIINKGNKIKFSNNDLQDLVYEKAIILDKRSYLRMYWCFLLDSQIILGTFFADNNLDIFVIKLSFLVFTFQISFFLNALFYTDEYISDAYHNEGVLDFLSGLPKCIYSSVATLIITNLLKMLSSSKNEL